MWKEVTSVPVSFILHFTEYHLSIKQFKCVQFYSISLQESGI